VDSLFGLKDRLSALHFFGGESITVSVGICSAGPDSYLTDQEILQEANDAEAHAKKEGRNCVVINSEAPDGERVLTTSSRKSTNFKT